MLQYDPVSFKHTATSEIRQETEMTSNATMRNSLRYARHLVRLLAGKDVFVPHKITTDYVVLGSEYGQWPLLPAMTSERSIVYSFGVGEDISFDLEAIDRFGCHVYAFDPTPRSVEWIQHQSTPPEFHFLEFGIGAKSGEVFFSPPKIATHVSYSVSERGQLSEGHVKARVLDLQSIMQQLNHPGVDILKMDVEGTEYSVIESLVQQSTLPWQLMVEFHHGLYGYTATNTKQALNTLWRHGYYPYYVSHTWREFGFLHRDSTVGRSLALSRS
jgi:FkbM family methyltransferase